MNDNQWMHDHSYRHRCPTTQSEARVRGERADEGAEPVTDASKGYSEEQSRIVAEYNREVTEDRK